MRVHILHSFEIAFEQDNLIRNIDGDLWIEAKRTKTNAKFSIPLLPTALAVLEKYKDHPKVVNGECVLPVLSNQKANAYLKEIGDLCGIKKNLTTYFREDYKLI